MPEVTLIEGIRQAMDEELARDENVFIIGEDVVYHLALVRHC